MGRWPPDARGRLTRAALDLYVERGYDQTTVTDIAQRAGVTERTFFRYFADKREVLFDGSHALEELLVATLRSAPTSTTPIDAVAAALEKAATLLIGRRDFARQRAAAISANPSLQERELLKLASLGAAATTALRRRAVPDAAARLAAETGVTVFKVAFERWIDNDSSTDLAHGIREAFEELKALAAHPAGTAPTPPG